MRREAEQKRRVEKKNSDAEVEKGKRNLDLSIGKWAKKLDAAAAAVRPSRKRSKNPIRDELQVVTEMVRTF
jgi:hypothetical protein